MFAAKTEAEMVDDLSKTFKTQGKIFSLDELFLAGVVFDNPESYKTGIPHNISYTIR